MEKDQHTIFGINGCTAVLETRKYKITDILIQTGSPAERDEKVTRILGYHGARKSEKLPSWKSTLYLYMKRILAILDF